MKFRTKDVDIATGGILVAILNWYDAAKNDLHTGDRLVVKKGRKSTVAVLDIAESSKIVKRGEIGLMEEVLHLLGTKQGDIVTLSLEEKPKSIRLIRKKLDGKRLNPEEIMTIIKDVAEGRLTSIEITYFIAGSYANGMNMDETVSLTKAMINTGEVLKPDKYPIIDKHCIGGVAGNRTTMVVVPILIAAGYCVPKTSSRSITSPAGTADTMEVLSHVTLPLDKIKKVVEKVGGCMTWGGAVNLAPADDRFITVEHPLSIDAESQLLASILAKKGSVSATHVLIDIPVGKGAKVESLAKAKHLRKMFEKVGHKIGMHIHVEITDGTQPIGNGIGPALEARDVLWVLGNYAEAPQDLKKKSIRLAGHIMSLYPLPYWKAGHGMRYARKILESGKAYDAMKMIIAAQGKRVDDPKKIKVGKWKYDYTAWKDGTVKSMSNRGISGIAKIAGAPADKGSGIYLHKHVGDRVKKREPLFTVYADGKQKLKFAKDALKNFDGVEIRD